MNNVIIVAIYTINLINIIYGSRLKPKKGRLILKDLLLHPRSFIAIWMECSTGGTEFFQYRIFRYNLINLYPRP